MTILLFTMPLILYALVFKHILTDKEVYILPLFISVITFVLYTIFNILSSYTKCEKVNVVNSMKYAFFSTLVIPFFYIIIYLLPSLGSPIKKLLSYGNQSANMVANNIETGIQAGSGAFINDKKIIMRIIIGFYLAVSCWPGIVVSYIKSIQNSCKLNNDEIKDYRKKLFKELEIEKDLDTTKLIEVQ